MSAPTKKQQYAIGAVRVAQNGYRYTKVKNDGPNQWRLTHHLRAEEALGRTIDSSVERVLFIDGDRTNLSYDNLKVVPKGQGPLTKRRAEIEDRIRELTAQLDDINAKLRAQGIS